MNFFFHSYFLQPVNALNAVSLKSKRSGALLKIEQDNGSIGYADLHPWPELGDLALDEQLKFLAQGQFTDLTLQSIWLAQRDAEMRDRQENGFTKYPPVKNNFLITEFESLTVDEVNSIKDRNFSILKIKVHPGFKDKAGMLNYIAASGFKIRFDFNATATWFSFKEFMNGLSSEVKAAIEYVEDPFPFDFHLWLKASETVSLAVDNQYNQVPWQELTTAPFKAIVIKPAKTNVREAMNLCDKWNLKATVTSYMDHPVGVSHALNIAIELKQKYPERMLDAGCMTHDLYLPDDFSKLLSSSGAEMNPVEGTGIGFDRMLKDLTWQKL